MAALTALLVIIGGAISVMEHSCFFIAMAINFFSYYNSDKIAIKMTGSKPIAENEALNYIL